MLALPRKVKIMRAPLDRIALPRAIDAKCNLWRITVYVYRLTDMTIDSISYDEYGAIPVDEPNKSGAILSPTNLYTEVRC